MTRPKTDIVVRLRVLENLLRKAKSKQFVAEVRNEIEDLRIKISKLENMLPPLGGDQGEQP